MAQPNQTLRGDEAELFARLASKLRVVVATQVNAPDAVIEDACMNAWSILLRRQPERDTVWAWLKTVATREAWRLAERERREDEDAFPGDLADAVTVDAAFELHAELDQLRAELDARKRRMLLLHAAGFSYAEIARITGDTQRTVERQLLRARRRAREIR